MFERLMILLKRDMLRMMEIPRTRFLFMILRPVPWTWKPPKGGRRTGDLYFTLIPCT